MNQQLSTADQAWRETIRKFFTDKEWTERDGYIVNIKNWKQSTIVAAKVLVEIKKKNLYRPHKTWQRFCEMECGITRQWAHQLMVYAKVLSSIPGKRQDLLTNVDQARELEKVPEERRVEVLKAAEKAGKITAQSIASAASTLYDGQTDTPSPQLDVDKMGHPIPKNALPYWNRRPEAKMVYDQIKATRKQIENLAPEDPMWCEVNLNGVLSDLYNAVTRFAAAIPDYVCAHCQGLNTPPCPACKGRGVVSEYYWKTFVPLEFKMQREAACRRITKT